MLEVARKPNKSQSASSKTAKSRVVNTRRGSTPLEIKTELALTQERLPSTAPVKRLTKAPVITGEAQYKGMVAVDGIVSGHLGSGAGALEIRQNLQRSSQPELSGQFSFRDVVRVNGHIAGSIYSKGGTLIVDSGAEVDANVDVGVAVIRGTVNGDIVAHQRVELAWGAKVFGNIRTRSISIEVGADFDGVCTMLEDH